MTQEQIVRGMLQGFASDRPVETLRIENERLREARDAAIMAKTRLDDFADKANAGQVHYSARELKRRIWAAFADFDALEQRAPSPPLIHVGIDGQPHFGPRAECPHCHII